jgi:hypothetical protein
MMNDSGSPDLNESKKGASTGGTGDVSDKVKKLMNQTIGNARKSSVYGGFILVTFVLWYLLSSGDFSFLLTLAALWRCFGLLLLLYKVAGGKTAKSVSAKTLQLYAVSFLARLLSITRHQGYLPFDKTGDWFYHVVEFVSFVAAILLIYGMLYPLNQTYDTKYDKFGNYKIPPQFGAIYLLVPCALLAVAFHPELNKEFFSDTCWTFSMYLESVAMIPQLYMFQKQANDQDNVVDAVLGHFTFTLGFSRIFELIFWVGSFKELSNSSGKLPGYIVLLSQIAQLLIMGDFFYYYAVSVSKGVPMELPISYTSTNV